MALLFPVGVEAKVAASRKPKFCGRIKHREARVVRVSDAVREGRMVSPLLADPLLPVWSSSPASSSLSLQQLQQQKRERVDDWQKYYVNMGYAIRTLKEEFPVIFYREPSFDVYRHNIVFKDPLNIFVGIYNYKRIFWALRFHGQMFFKALWVDITSVWQPAENVIMIRWIVHGVLRVLWESHARFDGTSEYKLDTSVKIFEHQVDNVAMNSPPKFRVSTVGELLQALACPATPKPTYFEMMSPLVGEELSCLSHNPFLERSRWLKEISSCRESQFLELFHN